MTTRREFLQLGAGTLAGLAFVGCDLMAAAPARAQARRREVVVNGRRAKTVDVHAHCAVPEALALMNLKLGAPGTALPPAPRHGHAGVGSPSRDGRAGHRRGGAQHQSELVQGGPRSRPADHPDPEREARGGVRRASRPLRGLRHRRAAAPGSRRRAARGGRQEARAARAPPSAAASTARRSAIPKFHPFWAKAEQLGVVVFIHPQGDGRRGGHAQQRFKGNGYLDNVIGNPLETTIALSHLIFEGTLDRFPGLKICAAHAGGFLPSYAGRSDRGCPTRPGRLPRRHARADQEEAVGVPEADVLRHDGVLRRRRPPPRRRGGRGPARWSAPTFPIRGRRPRWTSSSRRRA